MISFTYFSKVYHGSHLRCHVNLGRKIGIQTPYSKIEIPENSFDKDGNILKVKRDNNVNSYSYDKLSQITKESGSFNQSYEYDSLNNIQKIDDKKFCVNELNELLICGDTKLNYDKRGFLSSREQNNETTVFKNNAYGNLNFIKNPDKWQIGYCYDVFGRRLSKSYKATNKNVLKEIYLYFGNEEIGTIDSKNNIIQLKVSGPSYNLDTARSVAFELEEGTFTPTYDLQGNVISIIDSDYAEKIESYEYSVFGNEMIFDPNGEQLIESAVNNPWRFANKRKDETTGLINFGLRDYDPNIGRWIGPDPIGFADGMNPYAFVHNNPLKYTDLLGTSRHHNYKKCSSFEEYFYDNRMDEIKKGGDIYLVGGQVVAINDHFEISENFRSLLNDSIKLAADVADLTLGVLEIGTGFIGLGGSGTFEIGTLGVGALAAVPVAAGSTVLIVDGARRIESGYNLFRKASKNYDHNLDKQHKGTPKSNVAQNKQARDARRKIEQEIGRNLTDRERRILHDAIHGKNYGYWEIVEEGLSLFKKL